MQPFKYAHASGEHWREVTETCLRQLGQVPAEANLGFLYVADRFAADLPHLLAHLKAKLPVAHWFGTLGIGVCASGQEYFDEGALAVMLGEFPPESFAVFNTISSDLDEFHHTHADWYSGKQALFGLVHGDPNNARLPSLLVDLADKLDEAFLVGGLTSSRSLHYQVADQLTEGGLSGVLFSNQIAVTTRLTQGCVPIGERHEITDCHSNIVMRLDGKPALDVFRREISTHMAQEFDEGADNVFVALPVPGSDTADYMVRNLLGVDVENKRFAIGEVVSPGMQLMFTRRDNFSAEQDLRRMLEQLKRSLNGAQPRGAVYYSCLGRGQNLFSARSLELHIIEEVLGHFPLVGMFAGGEISHNRIYSYTGVLTLFL